MVLEENRDLLIRFRKGDKQALEEVYMIYVAPVAQVLKHGFAFKSRGRPCRYKGTRSGFELEDRIHEVFLRAFSEKARLNYDGLTPYTSYLRSIAKNMIIDEFRRKEHSMTDYSVDVSEAADLEKLGSVANPLHGEVASTGHPLYDTESKELAAKVVEFTGQLATREQLIFRLRFQQELEHQEISAQTGLSASKIKTSEQRIRIMFFDYMKNHGYFAGYVQEKRGWLTALRGN
jgi:RNA polymerase sigma factor (sigma-70 family)